MTTATADPPAATLLPLPDAAARLGISTSALRRRLHAGAARGERRPTASGFAWWVAVEEDAPTPGPTPTPTPEREAPTPTPAPTGGPTPTPTPERPQEPPGGALARQRAEDMAVYTERLVGPLYARLEAQAEEIGRLKAELSAALANGQAQTPSAPPAEAWPEGRPWWQRLLWG